MAGTFLDENPSKRGKQDPKRFTPRDLPATHNAMGLSTRERGFGRGASDYMRTEQMNFDHVAEQLKTLANGFNERMADTEYLAEQYEDHDEGAPSSPRMANLTDIPTYINLWHPHSHVDLIANSPQDQFFVDAIPFWPGENMYVDRIAARTQETEEHNAGIEPWAPQEHIHFGMFNGDGPGGAPGTLLLQATHTTPPDHYYPDQFLYAEFDPILLQKGHWYWIVYFINPVGYEFPNYNLFVGWEMVASGADWSFQPVTDVPFWGGQASPMKPTADSNAIFDPDEREAYHDGDFTDQLSAMSYRYEQRMFDPDDWESVGPGNGPEMFPDVLPFNDFEFGDETGGWAGPWLYNIDVLRIRLRVVRT